MALEKQTYMEEARLLMESYRARLDRLRIEALQADDESRMAYHLRIGELQSHLQALLSGVADLEKSQGDTWQRLRKSVDSASREFGKRLDRAMALRQ